MALTALTINQAVTVKTMDGKIVPATVIGLPTVPHQSDARLTDHLQPVVVRDATGRIYSVPRDQVA